jgi:hypothetical protein
MQNKKILFITYDLSGYYDIIHEELQNNFSSIEYHNTATLKFKYKNVFQKIYSGIYKLFTKRKLKNYYKLQPIVTSTKNKKYDYILIIRPDIFFDSQLKELKGLTDNFIAYYHDSINNINRKKDVIPFFDKVYSYEKKDVEDFNLNFISNFIYLKDTEKLNVSKTYDAFTIMSKDFRFNTLLKMAEYLQSINIDCKFLVHTDRKMSSDLVEYISERKNNQQVLDYLKDTNIIVDIHKFGVQDGLTFRVFESLFFNKKLITTNTDIVTYDFYNPNNIFVIEDTHNIDIPHAFFETDYIDISPEIYNKYHYTNWLKQILN